MKTFVTTSALLIAATLASGCADDHATRTPQTTGAAGNTPYQDIDVPAQPASAEIRPSTEPQQSATTTNEPLTPPGGAALPPYTPSRSMPSGNTVQAGGAPPVVPGSSARNPGNVPPTVQNGGNTAGTLGR